MLETVSEILEREASEDAVAGFIEWRKALKKPLTTRAASMIAKTLREIKRCGGDADEALDLAAEHGYQTMKAAWYWDIQRRSEPQLKTINGGRNGQSNNNQRSDPALEQIARLAGLEQAQGDGCL